MNESDMFLKLQASVWKDESYIVIHGPIDWNEETGEAKIEAMIHTNIRPEHTAHILRGILQMVEAGIVDE